MGRLGLLLSVVLMSCAISLVTSRYQARQLFMDYNRAQAATRDLENDWRRLQLDRAELQRNARVDHAARGELKMIPIVPDRTIYLSQPPIPESGVAP